jgi:hypothetical protein
MIYVLRRLEDKILKSCPLKSLPWSWEKILVLDLGHFSRLFSCKFKLYINKARRHQYLLLTVTVTTLPSLKKKLCLTPSKDISPVFKTLLKAVSKEDLGMLLRDKLSQIMPA